MFCSTSLYVRGTSFKRTMVTTNVGRLKKVPRKNENEEQGKNEEQEENEEQEDNNTGTKTCSTDTVPVMEEFEIYGFFNVESEVT